MPIVEDSVLIAASQDDLFALSQDYALRREWDPFVRAMRFLDDAQEADVGVHVWVRAWTGFTMTVRFVSFCSPTSVAMKMTQGPWFFRQFAGTWLFKPQGAGLTKVTFRYAFVTRWRWLGLVFDPLIAWAMGRDLRARLRGLKRGAEQAGLLDRLGNPCA